MMEYLPVYLQGYGILVCLLQEIWDIGTPPLVSFIYGALDN